MGLGGLSGSPPESPVLLVLVVLVLALALAVAALSAMTPCGPAADEDWC